MNKGRLTSIFLFLFLGSVALSGCTSEQGAIKTSLEWARLANLPKDVQALDVKVKGSMFSREFELSFKCPEKELKEWLAKSPGIKDAIITEESDTTIYSIKPGGGAQFAELRIYWSQDSIFLRTYWS